MNETRALVDASELLAGGGEMGALMRSVDWSGTPLGPVDDWPLPLRTMVGVMLGNRHPMAVWWGPDCLHLYNDAYRTILGDKHPASLCSSGLQVWRESWQIIGPMAQGVLDGGAATWNEDFLFPVDRRGFLEETYFTFSYSPIPDEGRVGGVLVTTRETTKEVQDGRQLRTLRDLAAHSTLAKTAEDALDGAARILAKNDADLPFVLLYLAEGDGTRARLAATAGMDGYRGDGTAPEVWPLEQTVKMDEPLVLSDLMTRVGAMPGGRWNEPPSKAVVVSLSRPGLSGPYGFLVSGVNPRRLLDDHYLGFFRLVAEAIVATISNARAYEEERKRAEMLAELDRAKTTFFSNISHEFRTPLTLMLGPLEDALASRERSLGGESLEATYRNALRLLKLVNTLLDFSRIEAGRLQASYEPVDLAAVTGELASVFRSAIERAGLKLVLRCEPLPEVYVDRGMWEKIVLNLVSNAFKFTFDGEIEVALRAEGDHVELKVRDTGIGVPPHELPRIFERFHRIEGVKARTHEGSGIGLALVQELVRLHGGEIRAESEAGRGTTFTVSIRTGTAHLPKDHLAPPRPHAAAAARAAPFLEEALRWLPSSIDSPHDATLLGDVSQKTDARVLVVDDNADLRDYLRRILGTRWLVETRADGQSALEAARRAPPDLVLTDVMMPGVSGFDLLRELRRDPRTESIPVVMLSARAGEEARVEGLEAGADDYLIKPFSARELIARVASQLALSAAARERALLLERERTARKEAELQKQHLFSLFMQAPTPIVILRGPEFVIELANPHACELWGREHESVVGLPLFEAVPELVGQVFRGLLENVMRTGEAYVGKETPAQFDRRGDGNLDTVFFTFVYAPLRNVRDEVEGVLVFAFDVTDEVVAHNQINELRVEAELANRAKDEFLAMLGHELRNPLSPMLTALQLMRLRGKESREQEILERQVGHLTRLVDDLLDVSRITRGKIELRKQNIELADAVARALEISSPLLEQRRHHVDLRVPRHGLGVNVDSDRMAQVISNLLTNAAKYSEAGSKILVSATRRDEQVRISVKDEGMGIAPDMIGRVFDRFVQQPQTLDRSKGGLGLGLAIVRSIVELHGGTVHATSAGVGKGSEFVIELPAVEIPSADAAQAEPPTPTSDLPRRMRILVVDDSADAVETLKNALEVRGYVVEVAHDGPSALKTAETFEPDVALLDLGLPVMDGYELAKRLREHRHLHLVAVTGYGQEADRQRSAAAGFEKHLVKPVDLHKLERIVEELRS